MCLCSLLTRRAAELCLTKLSSGRLSCNVMHFEETRFVCHAGDQQRHKQVQMCHWGNGNTALRNRKYQFSLQRTMNTVRSARYAESMKSLKKVRFKRERQDATQCTVCLGRCHGGFCGACSGQECTTQEVITGTNAVPQEPICFNNQVALITGS